MWYFYGNGVGYNNAPNEYRDAGRKASLSKY